MAKLYFRYGAMNAGKSTLLMQAAYNYEQQGMKVLIFKPSVDTKGDEYLVSRIGLKRKVDAIIKKEDSLIEIVNRLNLEASCIFVDEAQFLTSGQVDELMEIVVFLNIPVICYGLRCDFLGQAFEGSSRLLSIAHTIEEMKTICTCGKKAMYNVRLKNGKYVFSGNQILIDGDNNDISYTSLCPVCYYHIRKKVEEGND